MMASTTLGYSLRLLLVSLALTMSSTATAAPALTVPALQAAAQLTVTHGSYRYVASPTTAQLAVLRPDGSQFNVALPGIASALFIHEGQLYIGFMNGELRVFSVGGAQAAAPILTLRHQYPHPVGGFALTNGQVISLPVEASPAPPPPPVNQAPARDTYRNPEPRSGLGPMIGGAIVMGIGTPIFAIGLNRRLDRELDGIGWMSVGGVGLGVGLVLVGLGAAQANRHRRWMRDNHTARLTPTFHAKRGRGWILGGTLRF